MLRHGLRHARPLRALKGVLARQEIRLGMQRKVAGRGGRPGRVLRVPG